MTINNIKEWISAKEAARMLGIHQYTLYKHIQINEAIKGKSPDELTETEKKMTCPPYRRMGSRIKFTREAIEKFIEESMKQEGD